MINIEANTASPQQDYQIGIMAHMACITLPSVPKIGLITLDISFQDLIRRRKILRLYIIFKQKRPTQMSGAFLMLLKSPLPGEI
jgi:hypothetical protein